MTIQEIQDGVVSNLKYMYTEAPLFEFDISTCNSLSDLVYMLGQYGYDRQGALGVLNAVIVK